VRLEVQGLIRRLPGHYYALPGITDRGSP